MKRLINKRLALPFFILLTAFNILPVGLLSIANFDLLKLLSLFIFAISLLQFRGYFKKEVRFSTFFFVAIFLSAVNMASKGKYMDWTLFYCLNYLNLFLLLRCFQKISDINDYIKMLIGLCVAASFVHLLFYLNPSLLEGKLNEIRMGSINTDASKIRVFIPGMGFIAMFLNYYILKLFYFKRLSPAEAACTLLFFASVFVFASVRTYLLALLVTVIVLLSLRKLSLKKIVKFSGTVLAASLLLSLFSADLYEFIASRFDIFFKLKSFNLSDVVNLDIDYDTEETFGTVYFRIMEVMFVLQNYFNDTRSVLFGNIGTLYDFLGVEQETAPHVSLFGIYYLFGLAGLITFSAFFIYYTRLILSNLKRFRKSEFEFLSIALVIFWFSLFVISFFGGIYYSELILLVTFVIAASLVLKKQITYESSKD
jgi:hypothetical protein